MKDYMINQVDVAYGDLKIIEQLTLEIPLGKITTIIGPNGCGKSTLLKAMGRIMKTQKGSIYLDGAEEVVSYGRYPYQKGLGKLKEEDKKIIDWALEVTKLASIRNHLVDNLSGGQRQRVWIALALAQQTDIILLDEPTTYLDMAYQLEVLELLEDLNREYGCTIVMVLHDLNLASRYADFLVALKQGEIICSGTPNEVITKETIRKVYDIDADIITDSRTNKPILVSYQLLNKKNSDKKRVAS
ncbi:MAG: fecE [Herbinix sp.]|nr:fecE [Herbinix sp.]